MGWYGYGIYDGDETQTCVYDFLNHAGFKDKNDEISDCIRSRKTILTDEMKKILVKNIKKVLKKMPSSKSKFLDEYDCIEWQMLLALFMDNNLAPPLIIREMGFICSGNLTKDHASDFNNPARRRAVLRRFMNKIINFKVKVKSAKKKSKSS